MGKKILVTGANGFVGSHLIRGLAKAGHSVRAMVLRDSMKKDVEAEGIEPVVGNVTKIDTLYSAMEGCDAVIHLVGIIQPGPGYTFQSIHTEGTRNVVDAAKDSGDIKHFIYQSALGTREDAVSEYHKTKYEAEQLTKGSGLNWTITRPSIIYGPGDGFTSRLRDVIRMSPFVPVIGPGEGMLQPIFIKDLVDAIVKVVYNKDWFGRYVEMGGPEKLTFDEIVVKLKDALGTIKPTLHVPIWFVRPAATVMEKILPHPPVTNDQLTMLEEDNICSMGDMDELGIKPLGYREGLREFLG
jgi:NADH dehydrogenase